MVLFLIKCKINETNYIFSFCPEKNEPLRPPPSRSIHYRGPRGDVPPMEELVHAATVMAKHGPPIHPAYARQMSGYATTGHPSAHETNTISATIEYPIYGSRSPADPRFMQNPNMDPRGIRPEEHIYERYEHNHSCMSK